MIETTRLFLRPFHEDDAADVFEYLEKPTVNCFACMKLNSLENAKAAVKKILSGIAPEISIHDFRMVTGPTHTNLIFDIVIPYKFRMKDEEILEKLTDGIRNTLGEQYYAVVNVDRDFSGN